MSRKQLKIYSNRDFKEASRLDRIYMWMIEPERFDALLSDEEERHARKLEQAYAHCYAELRRSVAVKWIQNNIQDANTIYLANRVLDDMEEVYGRFLQKNKALKQAVLVEKMYEDAEMMRALAKKLKDQGDYEAAGNLLEKANKVRTEAAKIEGLPKVHSGIRPEDWTIPEIIISSDPNILKLKIDDAEIDNDEHDQPHAAGLGDRAEAGE